MGGNWDRADSLIATKCMHCQRDENPLPDCCKMSASISGSRHYFKRHFHAIVMHVNGAVWSQDGVINLEDAPVAGSSLMLRSVDGH